MEALALTEFARRLGVHPVTVRRWIKAGKLSHFRLPGGVYRIPQSELDRMLVPVANG